jgi:hypothetical protein
METIFLGSRTRRLRALRLACLAFAAGCLWWGWSLAQQFGLAPGDGGILRPAAERYLWAAAVVSIGLAFLGVMLLACDRYVTRIDIDRQRAIITTLGAFRGKSRVHLLSEFSRSTWHRGVLRAGVSVNAPWLSLYASGSRLPYLIDAQADGFDRRRLEALVRRQS